MKKLLIVLVVLSVSLFMVKYSFAAGIPVGVTPLPSLPALPVGSQLSLPAGLTMPNIPTTLVTSLVAAKINANLPDLGVDVKLPVMTDFVDGNLRVVVDSGYATDVRTNISLALAATTSEAVATVNNALELSTTDAVMKTLVETSLQKIQEYEVAKESFDANNNDRALDVLVSAQREMFESIAELE